MEEKRQHESQWNKTADLIKISVGKFKDTLQEAADGKMVKIKKLENDIFDISNKIQSLNGIVNFL